MVRATLTVQLLPEMVERIDDLCSKGKRSEWIEQAVAERLKKEEKRRLDSKH